MATTIRPAAPRDAHPIAEVHVATWHAAYAGIVPQANLDAVSVGDRATKWTTWLTAPAPPGTSVLVADDGGRVVGFSNAGPSRDADGPGLGEIRAIYVLPTHWDTGTGRALHDASIASLRAARFPTATLWVLEANARARAFYERRGWRSDGTVKPIAFLGVDLPEMRYRIDLGATAATGEGS